MSGPSASDGAAPGAGHGGEPDTGGPYQMTVRVSHSPYAGALNTAVGSTVCPTPASVTRPRTPTVFPGCEWADWKRWPGCGRSGGRHSGGPHTPASRPAETLNPVSPVDRLVSDVSPLTRGLELLCHAGRRAYFRVAAFNYEHRLLARPNRTPAGTVWTYDPLNRHGRDEMLAAVAACCGPADVLYDVGANVGIYAVTLAAGGPDRRVVAFEPSPPAVVCLRANVARNRLADRVEIHAYGLGDEHGTRPFYVSTAPELSGFDRESATRWGATVGDRPNVPVRRLDDLSLAPPDVIKLDVEGGGPAVLRGGHETLERHRPTLVVETHTTGLDGESTRAMRDLLDELGYAVEKRDGFWVCRGGSDA